MLTMSIIYTAGPVNLPPDGIGLRAAMRKTHSYQWLEAACSPEATNNPEAGQFHPCVCPHITSPHLCTDS